MLLHGLASDSQHLGPRDAVRWPTRGLRRARAGPARPRRARTSRVGDYLLDDFADSLAAFLDAVGVPAATLCGHSLGGAIAVHFGAPVSRTGCSGSSWSRRAGSAARCIPLLRAAALPVAPAVLGLALRPRLRRFYARPRLHRALRLTPDNVTNLRRAARALTPDRRAGRVLRLAARR